MTEKSSTITGPNHPEPHRWLIDIGRFDLAGWPVEMTLTCLIPNCGKVSVFPQKSEDADG